MNLRSSLRPWLPAAATILLLLRLLPAAHADDYQWEGGDTGNFDDMMWDDFSDNPFKPNTGPPGGGDGADLNGAVLSASGGGVDRLVGGTLDVGGSFSANAVGAVTVTGGGNMTVGTVGPTSAGGGGTDGSITVNGANVTVDNATGGYLTVGGGGSLVIKGSVSSIDGVHASDAGSVLEVDGTVTDTGFTAENGASASAQGLTVDATQAAGGQASADGAGSILALSGPAVLHTQFLGATDGGQVTINGDLSLFGSVGGPGGGAFLEMDGAGSSVTVSGSVLLGPGPGGDTTTHIGQMLISNGAVLHANLVSADGGFSPGTIMLTNGGILQTNTGLGVGIDSTGYLNIESGSGVSVAGDMAAVAFGLSKGSASYVTITDAGSSFQAPSALVSVAHDAGSMGNVELDTNALMQVGGTGTGAYLHIGDGGSAQLSINGGTVNVLGAATAFEAGSQAGSNGDVGVQSPNGLTLAGPAFIGKQGTGTLSVDGAGASAAANGDFFVGGDGSGNAGTGHGGVFVSGGGQLTLGGSSASNIGVGDGTGTVGQIIVSDAGSSLTLTGVTIVDGEGEVAALNGAAVVSNGLQLGTTPADAGTMLVYNSGTTWTETNTLVLGCKGSTAARDGIAVNDGGLLRVYRQLFIRNTGTVTVTSLLGADPTFPNPPPPTTSTPNGRIFVGTDNFGPDGAIRVGTGGVLKGQGKQVGTNVVNALVVGKVVVGRGGKFQPGGDPDAFSITGDCDLSDGSAAAGGGETDFEIAGAGTAGTDYDQLIVSGTATLGGTLNLVLLPGYVPKVGDTFNFIQAGAVTGSFAQISAPGLTLSANPTTGGLSVTVTAVTTTAAPVINSASTATGYVGLPFAFQVTASNAPAGFTATGLPAGLAIDAASGLISGTPTAAGASTVSLAATNASGTGTGSLTLTVTTAPAGAPGITSAASATGQVGTAFSYQIAASNAPASFGAAGLPAGLSIDAASGLISGTPTAAGASTVTLSATNASGTGMAALALVIDGPALPTVTAATAVTVAHAEAGTPGVFTVTVSTPPAAKLVVRYTLKGSAVNGTDYVFLTGKAKIKPGHTTASVQVVPMNNLGGAASKTVKLVITPNPVFTVTNTTAPKVKIKP